ncbi:MAG: hypothetical protein U0271_45325 [Polyangiaceae bacterium]
MPAARRSTLLASLLFTGALIFPACGAQVIFGADCLYEGESYTAGETFPAADGCNSCTCEAGGAVSCTDETCPVEPVDCDDAQKPLCDPAPNCSAEAVCSNGDWACQETCPCDNVELPSCPKEPIPTCVEVPVCEGAAWVCEPDCLDSCEDQYPTGHDLLLAALVKACGCVEGSPCVDVCANTSECTQPTLVGPCGDCMNSLDLGSACMATGAFEGCAVDPACKPYLDCFLANQ